MKYRILPSRAAARALAATLWQRYQARECAARGLPPGSSLDACAGVTVPAITTAKCAPIESDDGTAFAVPIDPDAEQLVGADASDVREAQLPAKLREKFEQARANAGR